jgi:tetratricopeptide (TPR) repeat protein
MDIEGRLADLEQALKLQPNNAEALASKAWALQRKGDYEEALRLNELAIKRGISSDQFELGRSTNYLLLGRAMILHKAGRAAEAEKIFAEQRANAKTWSDFNSLCWRKATAGVMLESALQDCREALKLRPDSGAALDSLGLVLLRLGKLDEALNAYSQSIAKKTGASPLMGRALVHKAKGNAALAEADRAESLRLDPEVEEWFAEYGLKL